MPDWLINIIVYLIVITVFAGICWLSWKAFVWVTRANKKIENYILKDLE